MGLGLRLRVCMVTGLGLRVSGVGVQEYREGHTLLLFL